MAGWGTFAWGSGGWGIGGNKWFVTVLGFKILVIRV